MAKTQQLTAALVFFFFVIFAASSVSNSARLPNVFLSHGLAATEPTLNLALPLDDGGFLVLDKPATATSEEQDVSKPLVLPCDHMVRIKNTHVGLRRPPRLAGKYGPMVLNMLPKGPVPSSGPSGGTNENKD